jgi:DNA-binding transcriptional LysR family regulator
MDHLALYRTFLRVAEVRSFTAAALALSLPRSTVSDAVRSLEAKLGVPLFHRTTRRVALTPEGEALRLRCGALLDDLDEMEAFFRGEGVQTRGQIRVEAPTRIARRVVLPALPAFLALHPAITVTLVANDRMADLIEGRVDMAIRVGAAAAVPGLVVRALGHLDVLNVASPGYIARYGVPQQPCDLDRHVAVRYAPTRGGRAEPWEWRAGRRLMTREVPSQLTVDSAEALIAAGTAGIGLIQAPAFDVEDAIADGRLVEVMRGHRPEALPMSLIHQDRSPLPRRLDVLMQWLEPILIRATRCR